MYYNNITTHKAGIRFFLKHLLLVPILLPLTLIEARNVPVKTVDTCVQLDSLTRKVERIDSDFFTPRFYENVLSRALKLECHDVSIHLSQIIGFHFFDQKKYEEAVAYLDTAIRQSQINKDTLNLSKSLLYKSYFANSNKKYKEAVESLQLGLPLVENRDSSLHLTYQFHISLGDNFMELSDYTKCIGHYQKALSIAEQLNDPSYLARVLNNLGVLYRERRAYANALEYFKKCLEAIENKPESHLSLVASINLGNTFYGLGDYPNAIVQLQKVCRDAEKTDVVQLKAYAEMLLGKVKIAQREYLQASAFLQAAETPLKTSNEPEAISLWHQQMGHLYMQTNKLEQAEYHFQEAVDYLKPAKHSLEFDLTKTYALLAQLYEKQGKAEEALRAYEEYHRCSDTLYAKTSNVVLSHQDVLLQMNTLNKKSSFLADSLKEKVAYQDRIVRLQSAVAALLILFLVSTFVVGLYFLRLSRSRSAINTKLQELNARILDQRADIEQKNQILKKTNHELEQANDRLVHFVYSMAHDLRAPLHNIQGMLELLKHPAVSKFTKEEQQFVTYIQQSSNQMSNMIEELRTYAEIGQNLPPAEIIYTHKIIQEVLQNMQMQITKKKADITLLFLPTLRGHTPLVRQLFQNLINNALKYQSPASTPVIKIGCDLSQGISTFYVKDNGVGIPPDKIDSIFEMFNRAHDAEYEGSGMGLALCKRIVNIHGGKIWVESQPGQGSTFFFTLPGDATQTATFAESASAQLYPQFLT